jgi:hypothetical protein
MTLCVHEYNRAVLLYHQVQIWICVHALFYYTCSFVNKNQLHVMMNPIMNVPCHACRRVVGNSPHLCLFITYLRFPLLFLLGNHMSGLSGCNNYAWWRAMYVVPVVLWSLIEFVESLGTIIYTCTCTCRFNMTVPIPHSHLCLITWHKIIIAPYQYTLKS